jgi:hypothetical protein
MSETYRCDGCKNITDHPTLQIERADPFNGNGVRIMPGRSWHLCNGCSRRLDGFLATLGPKTEPGA